MASHLNHSKHWNEKKKKQLSSFEDSHDEEPSPTIRHSSLKQVATTTTMMDLVRRPLPPVFINFLPSLKWNYLKIDILEKIKYFSWRLNMHESYLKVDFKEPVYSLWIFYGNRGVTTALLSSPKIQNDDVITKNSLLGWRCDIDVEF